MDTTTIYQVDAFSKKPFAGNPAGVCLLNEPKTNEWMASVAAEMNLAETAFLLPKVMDTAYAGSHLRLK